MVPCYIVGFKFKPLNKKVNHSAKQRKTELNVIDEDLVGETKPVNFSKKKVRNINSLLL